MDDSQLTDAQVQALYSQLPNATNGANSTPSTASAASPPPGSIPVDRQQDGTLKGPDGTVYSSSGVGPQGTRYPVIQGMTHAQMLAALKSDGTDVHVSPGYDALHSIGPGLGKMFASIPGIVGDAPNIWHDATEWAGSNVNHMLGHLGIGTGQDDPNYVTNSHALSLPNGQTVPFPVPTSGDYNDAIQKQFGQYYQPQTAAGRATETGLEMLPAAFGGEGSLLTRGMRAAVPAIGSEGAGEAARAVAPGNAEAESYARMIGGLGGGSVEGLAEHGLNAPYSLTGKFMAGGSPGDIDAAHALMTNARGLPGGGVNLTFPEAYTQANGGTLNRVQHYIENSALGGPTVRPFFDQREGQVSSVTNGLAKALAPARTDPSMLGVEAQAGANGALSNVRQGINAQAAPHYGALPGQTIPDAQYAAISANPSYAKALADFRANPELSGPFAHLPDNDLSVVNEVQKNLGSMVDSATPSQFNPGGNNQLAAARSGAKGLADALARQNPDYAAAHDIVAQGRQAELAPLQAGPLGTIASTDQVPAQTTALFRPQNVGGANETVTALNHLGGQDANLPSQLVAQYIRNSANATNGALRDLHPGANAWGGAGLGVKLAGSPEQRAALLGGTQVAAGPQAASTLADMLDAFGATGKRLQPGSNTYFNEEMAKQFGTQHDVVPVSFTDPLEWGRAITDFLGNKFAKGKMGKLADFLQMEPDAAKAFALRSLQAPQNNYGLATALIGGREGANP